jgi:hypothetical protein
MGLTRVRDTAKFKALRVPTEIMYYLPTRFSSWHSWVGFYGFYPLFVRLHCTPSGVNSMVHNFIIRCLFLLLKKTGSYYVINCTFNYNSRCNEINCFASL